MKFRSIYNPQWRRDVRVEETFYARMSAAGFTDTHTGGGCTAWEKPTADGGYLMITNDSELGVRAEDGEGLYYTGADEEGGWYAGRYTADGESWVVTAASSVKDALSAAAVLPQPREGEDRELKLTYDSTGARYSYEEIGPDATLTVALPQRNGHWIRTHHPYDMTEYHYAHSADGESWNIFREGSGYLGSFRTTDPAAVVAKLKAADKAAGLVARIDHS
jgi:hypothetical protein